MHITDNLTWSVNTAALVEGWGEPSCPHPSSLHTTRAPSRVSWPAASPYGVDAAKPLTGRMWGELWGLQRISLGLSPPLRTWLPSATCHYQRHHGLFSMLASGKRFCSIQCGTTRLWNSFSPMPSDSWTLSDNCHLKIFALPNLKNVTFTNLHLVSFCFWYLLFLYLLWYFLDILSYFNSKLSPWNEISFYVHLLYTEWQ